MEIENDENGEGMAEVRIKELCETNLSTIKSISLNNISKKQIEDLAVVQITSSVAFDSLGNSLSNGLYDLKLGPTKEEHGSCVTCGLNFGQCPGHVGFIELPLPCLNPLTIDIVLKTLNLICFKCYKFRLSSIKVKEYEIKLKLLRTNLVTDYGELNEFLLQINYKTVSERLKLINEYFAILKSKANTKTEPSETEEKVNDLTMASNNVTKDKYFTIHSQTLYNEVLDGLKEDLKQDRCQNCVISEDIYLKKVRKENFNKFFIKSKVKPSKRKSTGKVSTAEGNDESENGEEIEEKLLTIGEIEKTFSKLYRKKCEKSILNELYGPKNIFFIHKILIPPSKFRPARELRESVVNVIENEQNIHLRSILKLSEKLQFFIQFSKTNSNSGEDNLETSPINAKNKNKNLKKYQQNVKNFVEDWCELQESVNSFVDSTKSRNKNADLKGVRQLLEKKAGLFRNNLMGKRVNFAARSVITPDPYIETTEIGVPVKLAKKLTFCEHVTSFNREYLAECVKNGPTKHPGAQYIETKEGDFIDLSRVSQRRLDELSQEILQLREILSSSLSTGRSLISAQKRKIKINKNFADFDALFKIEKKQNEFKTLKKSQIMKVYRFLNESDYMLANRQPTLHKPSIMGHKVRILMNDSLQTIRLHYTNCEAYNADFDGDEINLHFPQNYQAQAEAKILTLTHQNYISNTNGSPLRGLIQDHIDMALILTLPSTFLTYAEFCQMIYISCQTSSALSRFKNHSVIPCILKPRRLYSGKQVITQILNLILKTEDDEEKLTFGPSNTKTPFNVWLESRSDLNDFLTKVIFRRNVLCTGVLDKSQFGASNFSLLHCISEIYGNAKVDQVLTSFGRLFTFCSQKYSHSCRIEDLLLNSSAEKQRKVDLEEADAKGIKMYKKHSQSKTASELDVAIQSLTASVTSNILSNCLPRGQKLRFPENCLSRMVNAGAKGSKVNHSQISTLLGQQTLEGKRVPFMSASHKTLPSFLKNDPSPRAGGFISQRFLTGLKPEEYFFHCMAGREGLVDTAVKTSRSGYLQRSLVKGLESVSVKYDRTVRTEDNSVIQFQFGEDNVDTLSSFFLNFKQKQEKDERIDFLMSNVSSLINKLNIGEDEGQLDLEDEQFLNFQLNQRLTQVVKFKNKRNAEKKTDNEGEDEVDELIEQIVKVKAMKSLVDPGENVGVIAAQSIGEPSTQMTLNTFHLAGTGGGNVTLGIPRLRELLMQASVEVKTPLITLPLLNNPMEKSDERNVNDFMNTFEPLLFKDLITKVEIAEKSNSETKNYSFTVFFSSRVNHLIGQSDSINENEVQEEEKQKKILNKLIGILIEDIKKLTKVQPTVFVSQKSSPSRKETKSKKNVDVVESDSESETESVSKKKQDNYLNFRLDIDNSGKLILMKSLISKILDTHFTKYKSKIFYISKLNSILIENSQNILDFYSFSLIQNFIDLNKVECNDIHQMLNIYGVECARNCLIKEIRKVFNVYGIEVDIRHLYLVCDFMFFTGSYKGFNRISIRNKTISDLLKMSYETTGDVLKLATLNKRTDFIDSKSAQIVVGKSLNQDFKLFIA